MAESYVQSLLGDREAIVLVSRQHWFILVSSILLEIVAILFIFAVTIAVAILYSLAAPLVALIGFLILLIPIATMTRDILSFTNRQFIVTNRRVMQIGGIFNKYVVDSSLEKVNDIMMTQSAFGRIFNYGDVQILTASEMGANLFKRIEDPIRFKTAMLNAKEKLERDGDGGRSHTDIPDLMAEIARLRQQGILSEDEFQRIKQDLITKI